MTAARARLQVDDTMVFTVKTGHKEILQTFLVKCPRDKRGPDRPGKQAHLGRVATWLGAMAFGHGRPNPGGQICGLE